MTEQLLDLCFVNIKVGGSGNPTGQQGSYSNSRPAGRRFHKSWAIKRWSTGPRCAESRFAKLTHRSELEQVGVHRDVVGDFDSVPHDPGDQEHPSLLERDHHERKKKGRIYFPPASTAQFEQRAKK